MVNPILAGLALLLIVFAAGSSSILAVTGGFTTLAISNVQYFTTDPASKISGDVFGMTVASGGLAQWAEGTYGSVDVTPSTVSATGKTTSNTLKLEVVSTQQEIHYPLANAEQYGLYDFSVYKEFNLLGDIDAFKQRCYDKAGSGGVVVAVGKPSFSFDAICVYGTAKNGGSVVFPLASPSVISKSTVRATVGGQVSTGEISNIGPALEQVGDIGYVTNIGIIPTGISPDTLTGVSPSSVMALKTFGGAVT